MSTVQYPNKIQAAGRCQSLDTHGARGFSLEEDLNASNEYYKETNQALIYKKPTPVQVVHVDYPRRGRARITEAYYRTPSTTDYNGLYKGRYVDFEAKQTQHRTSFPKYLVQPHQIDHLKKVHEQGGIGFFIIRFTALRQTFFVDAMTLIRQIENPERKSIPKSWFDDNGILLREGLLPRIRYLSAIDETYLSQTSK